jgi:hypothetical protein
MAKNCKIKIFYQNKPVTVTILASYQEFFLECLNLEDGSIGCPETSVTNYISTLRNISEERISYLHRVGSLKSRVSEYYSGTHMKMRWVGHVARTGEKRSTYRVLVGTSEGKCPL